MEKIRNWGEHRHILELLEVINLIHYHLTNSRSNSELLQARMLAASKEIQVSMLICLPRDDKGMLSLYYSTGRLVSTYTVSSHLLEELLRSLYMIHTSISLFICPPTTSSHRSFFGREFHKERSSQYKEIVGCPTPFYHLLG